MDINKIDLKIDDVTFKQSESNRVDGTMVINWSSSIGFGELTVIKKGNTLSASTESIDCNDDKEFIRKLMNLLVDKINIIE